MTTAQKQEPQELQRTKTKHIQPQPYHEQFGQRFGEVVQHELDLCPELVGFELEPVPLEQRVCRPQNAVDHVEITCRSRRDLIVTFCP